MRGRLLFGIAVAALILILGTFVVQKHNEIVPVVAVGNGQVDAPQEPAGTGIPSQPTAQSQGSAGAHPIIQIDDTTSLKNILDQVGPEIYKQPELAAVLAKELFSCFQFGRNLSAFESKASDSDAVRTAHVKRMGARCGGLNEAQIAEYRKLLEYAAQNGIVQAQILYSAVGSEAAFDHRYALEHPEEVVRFRAQAMSFLNQAAGTGSAQAMRELAFAYNDGVITEANTVNAVAMLMAAQQQEPRPNSARVLQTWMSSLSPQDRQRAERISAAFLSSCCRGG